MVVKAGLKPTYNFSYIGRNSVNLTLTLRTLFLRALITTLSTGYAPARLDASAIFTICNGTFMV
jgi:hypothetical protein